MDEHVQDEHHGKAAECRPEDPVFDLLSMSSRLRAMLIVLLGLLALVVLSRPIIMLIGPEQVWKHVAEEDAEYRTSSRCEEEGVDPIEVGIEPI